MANPAQPCNCVPYTNICCCGAKNGISVTQPTCQTLPDGRVVTNPAFVGPPTSKSYWTYKFITDCTNETRAISNFAILICETISSSNLTVSEKIDGCGEFVSVPFTLAKSDPNFGTAPSGYQFLKVENNNRYEKGVCVAYRLELNGDYPTATQPIKVKAANNVITFDCNCFLVPKCPAQGQLSITKNCTETISNNQLTLSYALSVTNIGSAALNNVQFQDSISIPTQLIFGTITVNPPTLSVDTSTPGQIKISGNLGTLNPGQSTNISYQFPITAISSPGRYTVANTSTATATGTQATASCSLTIDAVQLSVVKCCGVTGGNKGSFTLKLASVGSSPDTMVNIVDNLVIPNGVTVQFNDFGGCVATFAGSGSPVPLNTNIAGPVTINLQCGSVAVPQGGSVQKVITFTVVSTSVFGTAQLTNTIQQVVLVNPDKQVFLGASPIPAEADINVVTAAACGNPC